MLHPPSAAMLSASSVQVPLLTAFGVVTGLLGALWTALCVRLLKLRARWIPQSKPLWRNIEVAVVAAITATVSAGRRCVSCVRH